MENRLRVTFGITDQFGDEYKLKGIVIRTDQPIQPRLFLSRRLVSSLKKLSDLRPAKRRELDEARKLPLEWNHGGAQEEVDLILSEEKRAYAANGRIRGGLGSLNVGLQSEPNLGWTTVGNVPSLLWDKAQAKPVDSPNLVRLIKLRNSLQGAGKDNLERYLLSHLHKSSTYADTSYFIFIALHRMDRTVNAFTHARAQLEGDKVYAYSNLLGTLAAVVSREHFAIDPALYPRIQKVLEGSTEHDFKLAEKINLARLLQLASELSEPDADTSRPRATLASEGTENSTNSAKS